MFDVAEFQKRRRGHFGKVLYYFETQESTNLTAEELAGDNVPEGVVVLANEQTGGRGRKDRSWFSPPDQNVYFSIIVRPHGSRLHFLPFMAALSVIRAIRGLEIKGDLKWPNDVLAGGRKLAGVLMQTSTEQNTLRYAIVGVGINVNTADFPEELSATATSIAREKKETVSRESLLASVLMEFERLYEKMDELVWLEFAAELERCSSYLRGCPVRVRENAQTIEGTTAGLDSFGGLILDTQRGKRIVYAGDVQSCRKE